MPHGPTRWRAGLLLSIALIGGLLGYLVWRDRVRSSALDRLRGEAAQHLATGDAASALEAARNVLAELPDDAQMLLVAGQACQLVNDPAAALDYLEAVPPTAPGEFFQSRKLGTEIALEVGAWTRAERLLQDGIASGLEVDRFQHQLVQLLVSCGRGQEARPLLEQLAERGQLSVELLCLLGDPGRPFSNRPLPVSDDPLVLLARGLREIEAGNLAQARQALLDSLAQEPATAEAYARLTSLGIDQFPEALLAKTETRLRGAGEQNAGVWYVRAERARLAGEDRIAARCLLTCCRLDLSHPRSIGRLAKMLPSLGYVNEAQVFADRGRLLEQVRRKLEVVNLLQSRPVKESLPVWLELSADLEQLGRTNEAARWRELSARWSGSATRPTNAPPATTNDGVNSDTPFEQTLTRLEDAFRESKLPDFASPLNRVRLPEVLGPPSSDESRLRLVDVAKESGLKFHFRNGDVDGTNKRVHTFTGGGVGLLDFDRDGWTDCLWAQGHDGPTPHDRKQATSDALFRNLGGGAWQPVSSAAGIVEDAYDQGVAAGDLDGDGFPEMYVANIGGNALWWNNGDGTFSAEPSTLPGGDQWTSSVLIADINGDAHPDLFDVNYLEAADLYERVCGRPGHPQVCNPMVFDGAADRLWVSDGAGGFKNVSGEFELDAEDGRGLGVIGARFAGDSAGLDLYVANDMAANRLLMSHVAVDGVWSLQDVSVLKGVAFDRDGRSRAGMGIAAGDISGDGLLDLCVTNFLQESNNLYTSTAEGGYEDQAEQRGVGNASRPVLGFGTQFLDVDLDGDLDLFQANGHIDDFTETGAGYAMPPQLLRNGGQGDFTEATLQEWLTADKPQWIGRAVARGDWNRDGRDDLFISRLREPAVLLENQAIPEQRSITLRFVGARDRDAIGTIVRVVAPTSLSTHQVIGGGGYAATNSMDLVVGIGQAEQVSLEVDWRGGQQSVLSNIAAGASVLIVEGHGAYDVPR
ncbi:MAG: FG-GAP-like repeat-containing protein [Planctomycetaceae bacterium]